MKKLIASLALAGTLVVGAPMAAQPYSGNWNSRDFWHGAPSGAWERIRFLQDRINRGERDGSLTGREAHRAQYQLDNIRRDAAVMRRNGFSPSESDSIQVRLDNLSRNIRWARNNANMHDPHYYDRYRTDYDAAHYYRSGPYQERYLTSNDEIYRGSDGRYYCKRSDGTTGLIVGAAAGGLLGNAVTNGGNRLPGTLIGGALGALVGREIDRSDDIRCR
jgi:glycine zipper 2TM protein